MSDWTTIGGFVFGCVVVLYLGRQTFAGSQNSDPLPPGPPGIPWVGNVIGINASAPWKTYAEWAKTYGDIMYSRLLGKDVIIVNSEKIARDLLEKLSRNYSDRPEIITKEMCGVGFNSAMLPYGDRWRLHRRFFHQTFRLDAAPRFLLLHHRKACQFLRRLLTSPEHLHEHVFEYTASTILNSTYNYDPPSRNDEILDVAADVLTIVVPAVRPDVAIIAGALPFLLYLPSWLPGMSFKKQMATARAHTRKYLDRPFEYALRRTELPDDNFVPSMVHDGVRHMEEKGSSEEEFWMKALKEAAGIAFLAASETSHSVLMSFFLMMLLNPGVQEKAQAQIDQVVGKTRLPTIEDRPSIPYIDAIFRETIRYCTPVPLLIPHAAVGDGVYEGFHIPKGALLVANVWSMAHDESRYPNPHTFIPERFLNDDGSLKPNDIEHIAFGFGRRICPGRHFADASVWGVIAKVLAVFKILRPLDENGEEMIVEPEFSSGIVVQPLPFKCRFVPRFPGMDAQMLEELIASTA